MDRTEEYNFYKDVYTSLIRFANYRASGFLAGERKACNNDYVFFSRLLNESDQLLGRAFRKGKLIAVSTEYFLDNYKKVINDPAAYLAYTHQDEIASLSDGLIESMSSVDTRFKNVFDRYWRDKCLRSVKVLYYRYLITDSGTPKYDGLGPEASKLMYSKILDFVGVVKGTLDRYASPEPSAPVIVSPVKDAVIISNPSTEVVVPEEPSPSLATEEEIIPVAVPETIHVSNDAVEPASITASAPVADDLPFLNFVYDKVVTKEYPASAILLSVLKSRLSNDLDFFMKVLDMDVANARKELGIGEVSAKEVNKLCEMMRRIVRHPGTRKVFDESEKTEVFAPQINRRLKSEHVRIYHSHQVFMGECNDSVVVFYLKVAGTNRETVKFQGLNSTKSQALLDIYNGLLCQIDAFIANAQDTPSVMYNPALHKLNINDEQQDLILQILQRSGHFPLFTVISILISRMEERKQEIIRRTLNVFNGTVLEELSNVATSMTLSRERIRQLRDACLDELLALPRIIYKAGLLDEYHYALQSDYDFDHIREEEGVSLGNEYITACVSIADPSLRLIGDLKKSLLKPSGSARKLFLVPRRLAEVFDFSAFIRSIDEMLLEKRFYPYRDDLEAFVRPMVSKPVSEEDFYGIVKECRQILQKGYPDNIINSQLVFPANARKTIPYLIEDILREFNRPMTAEEICAQLNERYPDLEQVPSKIGANALRNSNIVAVSRSSTYALAEWNFTEKRGGTIRDLAVEYLNSLFQPIAPLTDICDYIAKFREDVKESSVKGNLLAESSNKFSLYYKGEVQYIGFTEFAFGEEYLMQEKRQGRRPFKDSIDRLEQFIKANDRFPYTAGVDGEEARLSRFYSVAKGNQKKGILSPEELAELERIDETYGHLRVKKERVSWDERLERFAKYITENESLPYPSSKEYAWFEENKALYDAGELEPARAQSFAFLLKIMRRMNLL